MQVVVHYLRVWWVYLLSSAFVVQTNNVANIYFTTQKKLSPKQARWQKILAEFDFQWRHNSGRSNVVPNNLSRLNLLICHTISQIEGDLLVRVRDAGGLD